MINNLSRYIWLMDLVASHDGITFKDISSKWQRAGINPTGEPLRLRTFNNWKSEIRQQLGVDFHCDRHTNKYYIRHFNDLQNGGVKEWMLNVFTVSNMLSEREALAGRIILENVPSGQKFLKCFVDAMKENLCVRITYTKFKNGGSQQVILEPYCIKLYERRWYVLGHNTEKDALRTYALDRIMAIELLEEHYTMPERFCAEEYYADCLGVIHDDNVCPELIRLRVNCNQCDYLRSLPLHSSQQETVTEDSYSVFSYFLRPTFDFIQHILALREYAEVLEPQRLRDELAEIIAKMAKHYD